MVLEQNLSLVNKIDRLLRWGHWFTFFNILLALLITASYFFADPLPQSFAGWVYLLTNWLGHTAFLCFLFFIITIFPISLIFPYQRHVRGVAAVLATIGLVALIFDAYVYNSLGYHAGSASYEQTLALLRQQVITNLRNFILITTVVAVLLVALQLVISNFCWKKIARLQYSGSGKPAFGVFLSCFVVSHLLHIWADATQYDQIIRQDNILPLTYPATARTMLARYSLLDPENMTEVPMAQWQQRHATPAQFNLQCSLEDEARAPQEPIRIWVLRHAEDLAAVLPGGGWRRLDQHLSPIHSHDAVSNLIYASLGQLDLQQTPDWLAQLPQGFSGFSASAAWQEQMPWLAQWPITPAAKIEFHLLEDASFLRDALTNASSGVHLVMSLQGRSGQFNIGQASLWYLWPELRQRRLNEVSQHLDILPTVLTFAGCTQPRWIGDDLLQHSQLAKLNLINNHLYSFRKDKMLIVEPDGSYSVWSAGTSVRLNQRLDVPMLTDALKRLPKTPEQ